MTTGDTSLPTVENISPTKERNKKNTETLSETGIEIKGSISLTTHLNALAMFRYPDFPKSDSMKYTKA